MAAPLGNKNAAKAKVWEQAIKRALARSSGKDIDSGLDSLADKLVSAAASGEQWAIKEIGDRLDGKPAQAVALSGDDENPLVVRGIVDLVRPG